MQNKPVLNTEESNARILSGSESASEDDENADARHASRSSHPSPAKPLISGPLAVVDGTLPIVLSLRSTIKGVC